MSTISYFIVRTFDVKHHAGRTWYNFNQFRFRKEVLYFLIPRSFLGVSPPPVPPPGAALNPMGTYASHRRYVQWSMIFYSWRKTFLRLQYEEQQSKAFACSRKICSILLNAHYPISVRSKEKELIRMFEIVFVIYKSSLGLPIIDQF
jgi:hypothetical protein